MTIIWGRCRSNLPPSQTHSPSSTLHSQRPQTSLFPHLISLGMAQKPPPPTAWKTGEQLEFLLSREGAFKRAQEAETLERFWQKTFEDWYHQWEIPASPSLIVRYGSISEGRLALQREKNIVRGSHSPPRLRPTNPTFSYGRKSSSGSIIGAGVRTRREHAGI